MDRRQQLAAWAKLPRRGALSSYVPPSCCCKCWSPSAISGSLTRITKQLSDMTDAELAALEARMITIPGGLAREHVDEPQADGDTDAAQDGDGYADDACAEGEASGDNT